ncbi:type II secretion system protein E (plasmid) [Rhodoferax ferrireducens T118]|uniref:Type II secretion system protein E n=1 Tax=Albidiferax ferrireducens (strain ATCC BAA-621 / DSM 15236 / T118) TaxID=338969 RepID=Q21Q59_ALBFT|nr:ATPase, T2SS/T4P/T4SS family [Rhodoferax ferrireducens]ABD72086.1 type II secretion system protein E [Rhodoferax ferrireducens T118]
MSNALHIVETPALAVPLRTGEILIRDGVITRHQLEIALKQQRVWRNSGRITPIGEILHELRFADRAAIENAVLMTAGSTTGIFEVLLSSVTCMRYRVHPIRMDGETLVIQSRQRLSDREKQRILDACHVSAKYLKVVAADHQAIASALSMHEKQDSSLDIWIRRLQHDPSGYVLKAFMGHMIGEASQRDASDIHLDRKDDVHSWISYRIDGDMSQMYMLPSKLMAAIIVRIKTEAGMDASSTQRPQDGRISLDSRHQKLDIRVSSQPIAGGETIALRLLSSDSIKSLNILFPQQPELIAHLKKLTRVDSKTGGFILISGATGMGKSTTLYALLQELDRDRLNVMTVEDPVEYQLAFLRQIQLNQFLGEQATDMERSLLRQDPDVLVFGEMRDENSTIAALRLAESGHLVISTIHANDAVQTFERLANKVGEANRDDMLYILGSYLKAIIAQRLIKKLCLCARPATPEYRSLHAQTAADLGISDEATGLLEPGKCKACNNTGYRGRVMLHETLLIPDDDLVRKNLLTAITSPNGFSSILDVPGVKHIARTDTLRTLVSSGVIPLGFAALQMGVSAS